MVDFLRIATRSTKRGIIEVYPKFIVGKSSDLMIRGGDFYAIWLEDRGLWSTDEQDVIDLVDKELNNFVKENKNKFDDTMLVRYMWDSESGIIDAWHKYVTKQMRDNYHTLNETLIFSNQDSQKEQYASKRLNYPLAEGDISAWDELLAVLYSPEERHKIEWAIGAVVNGASKKLEKFLVFYGAPGTGKSTILKIIEKLFKGYYSVFDSKALGSSNDSFALEAFKNNPLVAIQHDGDLSKIEDNTRLNSLTSHETMSVNEKHKNLYTMQFISFLFMGTNKPVKITDAKSGIIRRLIDVRPTGEKIPLSRYNKLMAEIKQELGAIAWHCKEVFEEDPLYYDEYKPTLMMGESNDFYNFVLDSYMVFSREDGTTLKAAWEMYKLYCEEAKIAYPYSMRVFKSELMNYFKHFDERVCIGEDWVRSYYSGFRKSIFKKENLEQNKQKTSTDVQVIQTIDFQIQPSNLDKYCKDCPAQYGNKDELPIKKWAEVKTTLKDINTSKLHYVKLNDVNHIVIDFDLKGPDGSKSFERNLEAASKWPKTYAELSKSGKGIHLHYIYDGDAESLNRIYSDDIEVKVFTGNSSLRRKLTKCNSETINHLPEDALEKRKEKSVINFDTLQNEKALRTFIKKNLNKEYHGATKPSVDFIYKGLEDAYNSGMKYDVSDMFQSVLCFATMSTNNADYCVKLVNKMHFKSEEASSSVINNDKPLVFFDVEVFPNLFLINWRKAGKNQRVVRMINPSPKDIALLLNYRLIGFNCRRYDNHMLYARLIGYNNEELFNLSQKIIVSKSKLNDGYFQEAYNISYTDIYDYAQTKQSLKKWEIELGLHHQELGLPWDKPVPENLWERVAEYCDNDVISTEAVWEATQKDFKSREILTKLANILCPSITSTVNDTTNQLTGRIIFRGDKKPQNQFLYTNLTTGERSDGYKDPCFFPGYIRIDNKSHLIIDDCDEEIGEGGYVWAKPGMFKKVKTLDVASMHPHSVMALKLFGEVYTKNFEDLVNLRIYVKHEDWESAKKTFGGVLEKFFDDLIASGETDIAGSLKIAINSVYGLTSAKFDNLFRDPRNYDNIVAKRGALFMCTLKHEVQKMGAEVVHIKTDSIKIADPSEEIINYIIKRGKEFGYDFEVESIYERFCLVNDAVYVAKKDTNDPDYIKESKKAISENIDIPTRWTATGTQFQIPYVFKKCFSHEPIEFNDLCETKEVKTVMYLDMNEGLDDGQQAIYERLKEVRAKAIAGEKLTGPESKLLHDEVFSEITDEELAAKLASYHSYKFIGRVGLFTPIKPGCGGGELVREQLKKDGVTGYDAVVGTKGYRWLESEEVIKNNKQGDIDLSYYDNLVNSAIDTISNFGDYEWFVSDDDD